MDPIICYCNNVAQSTIEKAIADGAKTLADIRTTTTAGDGNNCKKMHPKGICCTGDIKRILNIV